MLLTAARHSSVPCSALSLRTSAVRVRRTTTTTLGPPPPPPPAAGWLQVATTATAVGSLAGLCGALAGMGGGFVMIPLLTSRHLSLRLTQHQAHGTSLCAVAATGLAGAVSYQLGLRIRDNNHDKDKIVDTVASVVFLPEACAVAATAMVTARYGALATKHVSGLTLRRALGWYMLFMAPTTLPPAQAYFQLSPIQPQSPLVRDDNVLVPISNDEHFGSQSFDYTRLVAPAMIGIGSGFLSGLFGVGGGTVVVPALTLCTDLDHHQALATSLAAMTLPALSGTLAHYTAGNVARRVAPWLALGAVMGAALGAQVSLATHQDTLRYGFASLLATLGVRSLLKL
jgi:uncharacterized protein